MTVTVFPLHILQRTVSLFSFRLCKQKIIPKQAVDDLLKGGSTQLDGDVLELTVSLGAEVSDDVRVLVRFPQQLNLSICKAEAFWENPLNCHWTVVKLTPYKQK